LFHEISLYVLKISNNEHESPATKKRRLDQDTGLAIRETLQGSGPNINSQDHSDSLEWLKTTEPSILLGEFSFTSPGRKKLSVELSNAGIIGRNPSTAAIECAVAFRNIERIICVAVPEKIQPQYSICVFPFGGSGTEQQGGTPAEPLLFTIPDGPPKTSTGPGLQNLDQSSYKSLVISFLNANLPSGATVTEPDAKEFASTIVQAHKKGEKAYFVKAHRGAKDGFLYFLSTGILFGFRKPLLFYAFSNINSVSYTSVLQRTFNLNITTADDDETEFAMIDQVDFAGIDDYIKRHSLNDASMAEQRRAKILNINGKANGDVPENAATESEISRVMREEDLDLDAMDDEVPKAVSSQSSSHPKPAKAAQVFSINGPELDESDEGEDYDPNEEDEDDGSASSDESDSDDEDDEDGEDEMDEE
jgi:hypothetical protein